MRIVNYAINNCRNVFRYRDDESSLGQFFRPQVNRATGTDLHRRRPFPAKRRQKCPYRGFVNPGSGVALSSLPFSNVLSLARIVDEIIDILVRKTGRDSD